MVLLAYAVMHCPDYNPQQQITVLWELYDGHHSAEMTVSTSKDRFRPFNDSVS